MKRSMVWIAGLFLSLAVAAQAGKGREGAVSRSDGRAESASSKRTEQRGVRHAGQTESLVLHLDFSDKDEGRTVRDASGTGNGGTAVREWESIPGLGRGRQAARFAGDGNYVRVPRAASLEPDELTLAVWMRVGDLSGMTEPFSIAFKRNSAFHWNEDYSLECYPNRVVRITVGNPGARQIRVDSRVALAPDLWHHVVMVLRRGSVALYFDGEEVAAGALPFPLDHNGEADLLIGARDHAAYPIDRFAKCDFADVRIWNKPLSPRRIQRLYREGQRTSPGVARPGDNPAVAEPESRRFAPPPGAVCPSGTAPAVPAAVPASTLASDVGALVERGRRDQSATPEFLDALERTLAGHREANAPEPPPSGKLPLRPSFAGPAMPAGWRTVKPESWRFGNGVAEQTEARPNERFLIFYEPGMEWTDYSFAFRFESDAWFTPPSRSSAFVYFRYHDLDDGYVLTLDGAGDLTLSSLDKGNDGWRQRILAHFPLDTSLIRDGKPWKVRLKGDQIEVFHEGVRRLLATDSTHPSGTIGLEGVHIPMRFSGVSVEPLFSPSPFEEGLPE